MIIKKVTVGFVVQTFDTEKKRFVHQEFVAGDQTDFETEQGDALNKIEIESFGLTENNPVLDMDMVQPVLLNCQKCGSPLDEHDRCTDETCPFADKEQES